jgi:hypothetical protein
MKTIILLLITISLLLQSCYSYKTINPENTTLVVGHTYKIKQNENFEKVKLKSFTKDSLIVIKDLQEKQIAKSDIKVIKKRKFSVGKTAILVTSTLLGGGTLLILDGISKSNFGPK